MNEDEVLEQEEVIEEPVVPSEPPVPTAIITTGGLWKHFEEAMKTEFEIGKTYDIRVDGRCEFMISKDKPKLGIKTNQITYTADAENKLWVKTGV